MAAGDFLSSVELISPSEFAKGKVLAVQNYVFLCGQAMANLFRRPLYVADLIQQADFIGWGSISIVVLAGFFSCAGRAPKRDQHVGAFWFCIAYWTIGFSRNGAAVGAGHYRAHGRWPQRLGHRQRTWVDEGD